MFHRFNEKARDALDRAAKKAKELRHQAVEPEHILASLAEHDAPELGETSFHSLLKSFDIPKEAVTEQLEPVPAPPGTPVPKEAVFSPEAKRVLEFAVEEADKLGHKRIGTSHFLLAFIRDELEGDSGAQTLTSLGLTLEDVRARVRELAEHEGAGKADVIPSILFFELDKRARDAEQNLSGRVEHLEAEVRELRAALESMGAKLGSTDGAAAGAEKTGTTRRKRGES